jgi:predicted GNAT family acetyltransferase
MNYSEIIKDVLSVIVNAENEQGIVYEGIYDEERKKYIVTEQGTIDDESFYNVLVAIKVEGDTIVIEHTNVDIDFREELTEAGVKYENIIFK